MRPGWLWALAAVLATVGLLAVGAPVAKALSAGELRIEDEASWHADPLIRFEWEPLPPPGQPIAAAYRLYDSRGELMRRWGSLLEDFSDPFMAPSKPGIYTLEAWLQDELGRHGPHSSATVRFDNSAPAAPAPLPPPGWVLGVEAAILEIGPPPAPLPLSGIRGYAVSVDRGGGSSPCASPTRCEASEIDLASAPGGSISLGTLPEGVNFVRAVAVSGTGVPSAVSTATVRVDGNPPLVSLPGVPAGWSNGPVQVTAMADDPLSGMAAAGPLGPFTALAVDGAAATTSPGGRASAWVSGSGIHSVAYFARDAAGNVAESRDAAIRIDEDPPTVAFAAAQDPSEPERVEAFVADSLSGPSGERGSIAIRPAGTAARFEQLPTQVAGAKLVARWDSDSYPPGLYELLATGFDAAGNAGSGTRRVGGGRMVLPSPLKTPVELAGRLSRLRFAGVLRGGLVAGQEIAVTETFAPGSKASRRTSLVRTRADGRFSIRLKPGPSREVIATFAGNRTMGRASSESSWLEVPATVRMRASATTARVGGAPVVFAGRVAAPGVERAALAGLPVELQFRFRGGGWSEFRTVETDRRGRFRYAYRFSDDDSRGVRFGFRAYVKGREGWPYGPSASRPVLVTGR
ncbi:MAG TPA: hypothetical protein VJU14_05055 [Solirubrobacterales bacterium]|nr:hypothetical protein [Solirubrobacterales bacterium]